MEAQEVTAKEESMELKPQKFFVPLYRNKGDIKWWAIGPTDSLENAQITIKSWNELDVQQEFKIVSFEVER